MNRETAESSSRGTFALARSRSWAALAEIARRQYGVVTLGQAISCGFSASGVRTLVGTARLHPVHHGVYALSPAELSREGNWIAAVLACSPGSLLAGLSAGAHYGLIAYAGTVVDVAAPRQIRRSGIRSHVLTLAGADRSEHLSIPCTSVARTLLDIAARRPDVLPALEQAEQIGIFDLHSINDVIARNPGHRGVRRLRYAVVAIGGPRFRSEFERRFLPTLREAGLPAPLVNHTITLDDGPIEVDFHWPTLRLVVEVDGYEFHSGRRAFREDRRRDRRLAAAGIRCLRFVWDDLNNRAALLADLRRARETAETSSPGTPALSRD
jgi:very-short-patch-repair endonuclease